MNGEHLKELLDTVYEKAQNEVAKEIYDLCCGHGTTYIKKYLREHYDFEIGEENEM